MTRAAVTACRWTFAHVFLSGPSMMVGHDEPLPHRDPCLCPHGSGQCGAEWPAFSFAATWVVCGPEYFLAWMVFSVSFLPWLPSAQVALSQRRLLYPELGPRDRRWAGRFLLCGRRCLSMVRLKDGLPDPRVREPLQFIQRLVASSGTRQGR